jgi:hypothetical protein
LIQEKETLYNNENINPTLIWELIKSDIRGYAIKYSSEVKKQETEVINLFYSFNTSVNLETVCPLSVTRVCIDLLI